jgi:hypothetical protein
MESMSSKLNSRSLLSYCAGSSPADLSHYYWRFVEFRFREELVTEVRVLPASNLLGFLLNICQLHHFILLKGSLFIATRAKAVENFRTAALLLFYILEKISPNIFRYISKIYYHSSIQEPNVHPTSEVRACKI